MKEVGKYIQGGKEQVIPHLEGLLQMHWWQILLLQIFFSPAISSAYYSCFHP